MIESLHYVAGEICEINSLTLQPAPDSFRVCIESLAALQDVAQAISPTFVISPDAEVYAESLRKFLWGGLLPGLIGIWGTFSIPKIIKGVFSGLY